MVFYFINIMYHKKIKTLFLFFYASVDGIKKLCFLIKIMQSIIFTRHTVPLGPFVK